MEKNKVHIKINKSKVYFTPLFNNIVPISYFSLLKNTYFWYDDITEETFCLLYKFDGKVSGTMGGRKGFTIYEQTVLYKSEYFTGFRDYEDYVIYEFKLNDELLEYRNILIEGKYSALPEIAKESIIKFNLRMYGPNDANLIEKILYGDSELRSQKAKELGFPMLIKNKMIKFPKDAELASALDIDNEVFANFVNLKKRDDEI